MGFNIYRNLRSYINHNLPFLLFGVYPLFFSDHRGVLVILLIIQVVFILIKSPKLSFHKLFFVNSALYILYIIVYLFLSQDKSTLKVFETGLSLLIMPFVFLVFSISNKSIFEDEKEHQFFNVFYISCFLYSSIGFIYIVCLGLFTEDYPYMFYINQLSKTIPIVYDHPIYSSLLLGIAIIYWFKRITSDNIKLSVSKIVSILVIVLFLLFLSRKGVIIASIVSLFVFFKNKVLLKMTVLLTTFLLLVLVIPSTRARMQKITEPESYSKNNETNSVNNRLNIYKCAVQKIKEKPIFGFGVNDDKQALYNCYKKELYYLYESKFNTHNQFLSVTMKAGIVGLIVFLFMLIYNFKLAFSLQNRLYLSLLVFFIIVMLTENILERQNGVIIFTFIINYFAFKSLHKQPRL
jgi:O-antigen ligase